VRVHPARVDGARDLDDGVVGQPGQDAVVRDVEDHRRAPAGDERRHEVQGHALVAAALQVLGPPGPGVLAPGVLAPGVLGPDALGRLRAGLRHVARLARAVHRLPGLQRALGVRRGAGVEVTLLRVEELPAGLRRGAQALGGLAGVGVVVQVLVRQRADRAHPVDAEGPGLLDAVQGVVVGEEVGQPLAAVHLQRAEPPEVVEPRVVEGDVPARGADGARGATHQPDRRVADADDALAERTSPIGVSQMPTTRSPSTARIASVTTPAGLVKLMTQASGATARTRSARWRACGSVRSA